MKRLALLLLLAAACKQETVVTDTTPMDTREPVSVRYVGAPELPVREKPEDAAPVIATYQNGEAMSVLTDKGEWVEVRTGDRAGWARAADLVNAEGKERAEADPQSQVKFKIMPLPVAAPGAHGEIYLEASVNSEGEVISVRTLANTTGSMALEAQNTAALMRGRFYPIVQNGERKPFKYDHHVTY
jgi:hypothetical protein